MEFNEPYLRVIIHTTILIFVFYPNLKLCKARLTIEIFPGRLGKLWGVVTYRWL